MRAGVLTDHAPMTTTDYLIDSALVLLVLLQIKERKLTTQAIVRPIIIVGVAFASYFHSIPSPPATTSSSSPRWPSPA